MTTNKADVSSAPARRRVSKLLATGHTPREIAARMGVSTARVYKVMDDLKAEAESQGEEAS